jgi:hypothetical protein
LNKKGDKKNWILEIHFVDKEKKNRRVFWTIIGIIFEINI